ncbi:ATP-binding protein [Streptomyces griseus]
MYRVVQEALTNAVKHAPGCPISVRITHEPSRTHVSVMNAVPSAGGSARTGARPGRGVGRGLMGLHERVAVLGGSLRTEPDAGRFHVTAVLPHQTTTRPRTPTPEPMTTPGKPTQEPVTAPGTPTQERVTAPGTPTPEPVTAPGTPARAQAPASPSEATLTPGPDTASAPFPPESAKRLASVRGEARRRSAVAFVAPVVAAVFFVPSAAYLAWQLTTSVLPPSHFDELSVGRPRAELAPLLPARAYPYPPDHARSAPRPPGTRCEFYRSGRDLLGDVDLYRLCWSGDTLSAKDTVRARRP